MKKIKLFQSLLLLSFFTVISSYTTSAKNTLVSINLSNDKIDTGITLLIKRESVIKTNTIFEDNTRKRLCSISNTFNRIENYPSDNYFIDTNLKKQKVLQTAITHQGISSGFHLFSHGRSGELLIEGEWKGAIQIKNWLLQKNISFHNQNIYIYGCHFAQGEKGKQAVSYLETALGISIAASDDLTGRGGDWDLEIGKVQAIALNIPNYQYTLQDSDGDSINDDVDLDDDNDGILDDDEQLCILPAATQPIAQISGTSAWPGLTSSTLSANTTSSGINVSLRSIAGTITVLGNTYNYGTDVLISPVSNTNSANLSYTFSPAIPANQVAMFLLDIHLDNTGIQVITSLSGSGTATTQDFYMENTGYSPTHGYDDTTGEWLFSSGTPSSSNRYRGTLIGTGTNTVETITLHLVNLRNADNVAFLLLPLPTCDYDYDLDGDGIPNTLDLDSDGDGCADAIEGGGNFMVADLAASAMPGGNSGGSYTGSSAMAVSDNLGNTVDTNPASASYGVPNTAGTGQTVSTSQNGAARDSNCPCTDSDSDTICDIDDLDDDNDGILDTDEGACPNGLTATTPFQSLSDARNVTTAGVYFFDIDGETFSTYVDDNGYVLIAIDFGNGTGSLPQVTALDQTARGILTPAKLAELTDMGEVRISHSGGQLDATTSNATIISRVQTNGILHRGLIDNGINNDWTGTNASFLTNDANCNTSGSSNLNSNVMHTCGSASGTAWIPESGLQYYSFSSGEIGNTESLQLWARGSSSCTDQDTDGDGIVDHLDLDSDGDGCADAVEGGGSFTTTDLVASSMLGGNTGGSYTGTSTTAVNDNLGNTVDTNPASASYGMPTTAGTGQTPGTSQMVLSNACLDSDSDGIADMDDLDDDNDGILDTYENACISSTIAWTNSSLTNQNQDLTLGDPTPVFQSATDYVVGAGLSKTAGSGTVMLNNVDQTTMEAAIAANDFATYTFTTQATLPMHTGFGGITHSSINTPNNYSFAYQISTDGVNFQTIEKDSIATSTNLYNGVNEVHPGTYPLSPSTTYTMRVIFYGASGEIYWDDTLLSFCISQDTDNDAIPDYLDLDADGDGCADAIEGGGSFTSADLVASGMPGGNTGGSYTGSSTDPVSDNLGNTVDTNPASASYGVPSTASSGQTVGDSQDGGTQSPECISIEVIAVDDRDTTLLNTMVTLSVLPNDTVRSSIIDTAGITIYTQPTSGGTATVNADGTINYNPATGFTGLDSLEYIICDTSSMPNTVCDTALVEIRVFGIDAVDDDFSAAPIPATGGTTTSVLTNDSADGTSPATDALIDDNINISNNGGLTGATIATDGTITVPANATPGTYTVQYSICLTAENTVCDMANVTIVVNCAAAAGTITNVTNN